MRFATIKVFPKEKPLVMHYLVPESGYNRGPAVFLSIACIFAFQSITIEPVLFFEQIILKVSIISLIRYQYSEDLIKMRLSKKSAIAAALSVLLIVAGLFLVATGFGGDKSTEENTTNTNPAQAGGLVPVEFTCDAGTKYAFNFTANLDLSDGMDSGEAAAVARSLYEHELKQQNYEVKSTQSDGNGCWTVYLLWGAVSPNGHVEDHSHYFNVHVNATAKTVDYDRCY